MIMHACASSAQAKVSASHSETQELLPAWSLSHGRQKLPNSQSSRPIPGSLKWQGWSGGCGSGASGTQVETGASLYTFSLKKVHFMPGGQFWVNRSHSEGN